MRNLEKLGTLISFGISLFVKVVLLLDLHLILIPDKTTQVLVLILDFLVGMLSIGFMIVAIGIIKMVVGKNRYE
jgi:hypothetical protein